ncbi:MAG TPA: response regulator [Caldithrix abyssi]|uniref:Response regulator n=1 Tax=Caldithrix abyssi TaxID=187145 RepID=A0A7V1PV68_CALAY|nr:response regulator [Caldithrix abyssi]
MKKILFIDDDPFLREAFSEILQRNGFEVITLEDGKNAKNKVHDLEFDLVITDIVMPEKEGIETITEIRSINESIPILAISGGGRISPRSHLHLAEHMGANATLEKPFDGSTLIAKINSMLG